MKKYLVYLMMALAAFTFNACGDDDPMTEEPGTEQPETPGDSTDNPELETATFLWHILVGEVLHSEWRNK